MTIDAAMMLEWGMPRPGREPKAVQEFTNQMQWYGKLKANGKIADFMPFGDLTGSLEKRSGFLIVTGTQNQITELRRSEEYRIKLNRVTALVTGVRVTELETGAAMAPRMQRYQATINNVLG